MFGTLLHKHQPLRASNKKDGPHYKKKKKKKRSGPEAVFTITAAERKMLSLFTWGGLTSRYVASEIFKANHGAIFNITSVMWKLESSTKKYTESGLYDDN